MFGVCEIIKASFAFSNHSLSQPYTTAMIIHHLLPFNKCSYTVYLMIVILITIICDQKQVLGGVFLPFPPPPPGRTCGNFSSFSDNLVVNGNCAGLSMQGWSTFGDWVCFSSYVWGDGSPVIYSGGMLQLVSVCLCYCNPIQMGKLKPLRK